MVATYAYINQFDRSISRKRLRRGVADFDYKGKTYLVDPDCIMFEEKVPWWGLGLVKLTRKVLTYIEDSPQPLELPSMEGMERVGIPAVELQKIFTPKFYEIIARSNNKIMQYIFYIQIGQGLAVLYIVYQLSKILAAVEAIRQAMGV